MKGGRVTWLRKKNLIFTNGFGKGSDRQMALYDPRKLSQRLTLQVIDTSNSSLLPFYEEDNGIMFLAGKGVSIKKKGKIMARGWKYQIL